VNAFLEEFNEKRHKKVAGLSADLSSYLRSVPAANEFTIQVGAALEDVEKELIRHTLARAKTKTEAAKLLRIGRRTLQRKLKAYGRA
jgi:DNA-binding protein Fis